MPHPIIYSRHQLLALHANSGLLHGRDMPGQHVLLGGHIPDRSFHLSSWGPYDPPPRRKRINGGVCNVDIKVSLLFVESWLTMVTLDVITKLNGFQMTQQSKVVREKQGDWLFFSTEDGGTWHTIWEQLRSKDDELVAISMRPYHLPGVFFHITVVTVYCTSQPAANGDMVCEVLHAAVSRLQTQHPSGPADLWRLQLRGKIRDREKLCRKYLAAAQGTGPHPSAPSPEFRFLWGFSSTFNTIQPILLLGKMEQVGGDHQLTSSIVYYLSNRDRGGERHTTVASQGFVEDVFVQR